MRPARDYTLKPNSTAARHLKRLGIRAIARPALPPRIAAFLPYNQPFYSHGKSTIMEAERINSLAALLQDLTERESQLRGYL